MKKQVIESSWAVLSGAADPARAVKAMASMSQHLVRADSGLALLFTPPFDVSQNDPGYIQGYPPGLREIGGQYSHAAMWSILAYAKLGDGDAAGALFAMLNPVNHALTAVDASRYKVEPYVIAADVYSATPHEGRGGWSWYTGSAAWMYRAGIEGLLGLTLAGPDLLLKIWPQVKATVKIRGSCLGITVNNSGQTGNGIVSATLDGVALVPEEGKLRMSLPTGPHALVVELR